MDRGTDGGTGSGTDRGTDGGTEGETDRVTVRGTDAHAEEEPILHWSERELYRQKFTETGV